MSDPTLSTPVEPPHTGETFDPRITKQLLERIIPPAVIFAEEVEHVDDLRRRASAILQQTFGPPAVPAGGDRPRATGSIDAVAAVEEWFKEFENNPGGVSEEFVGTCRFAARQIVIAIRAAGGDRPQADAAVAEAEPRGWACELAHGLGAEGYCKWKPHIGFVKPRVNDAAIRGLVPLYASPAAALHAAQPMDRDGWRADPGAALHIVFDGPPGPQAGRFVEVETPDGRGLDAGCWKQREDGLWALVLPGRYDVSETAVDAYTEEFAKGAREEDNFRVRGRMRHTRAIRAALAAAQTALPAPPSSVPSKGTPEGAYATAQQQDDLASREAYIAPTPAAPAPGREDGDAAFVEDMLRAAADRQPLDVLFTKEDIWRLAKLARTQARADGGVSAVEVEAALTAYFQAQYGRSLECMGVMVPNDGRPRSMRAALEAAAAARSAASADGGGRGA